MCLLEKSFLGSHKDNIQLFLLTLSFYPLLAISRPSWLFQLSQKQLNFLIHLSSFFFLKNVLGTFFSLFLSPFSMTLFKKWLSPYSYISHCFLFSDSANMQNFYPLFQYFISYPYHPLSDFFKGREVAVGIDFLFHPLVLVMWLHLFTKMLAFEVTDGQVSWSFLATFLPWALCDIYFVAQHFLIQLSLASGSLGPLPFSFHHPICLSFCLDSVLDFLYIWCPRFSSKFFFKSPLDLIPF